VIVSAQATGQNSSFNVEEGQTIPKDSVVGVIDPTDLAAKGTGAGQHLGVKGENG
jgi:multidrug efflux pump subunit AcrA (membrane-fusion protein)